MLLSSKSRVFLGGTCNGTDWRNKLEHYLEWYGISYFDPVVDDWTDECVLIENDEKYNKCNIHLYVITSEMTGVYSIAEIIDSAWIVKNGDSVPERLVVVISTGGFSKGQIRSLINVANMAKSIGGSKVSVLIVDDIDDNIDTLSNIINNSTES